MTSISNNIPNPVISLVSGQRLGWGYVEQLLYINMKKEKLEPIKVRGLRLSDKIWSEFSKTKPRDKSWELHIKELLECIKYFKNL